MESDRPDLVNGRRLIELDSPRGGCNVCRHPIATLYYWTGTSVSPDVSRCTSLDVIAAQLRPRRGLEVEHGHEKRILVAPTCCCPDLCMRAMFSCTSQAIDFDSGEASGGLGIACDVLSDGSLNASARLPAFLCSLASSIKVLCTYRRNWRCLTPTRVRRMPHATEDPADNHDSIDSPVLNSRIRLREKGVI